MKEKKTEENQTEDVKKPHKKEKAKKSDQIEETKEEKKADVKAQEGPGEKPAEEASEKAQALKKRKNRVALVHVYSSKNDTIITATDMSGSETLGWASGGMVVKSAREEGKPYAAMQATLKVVNSLKEKGITIVHVRIRAPGGSGLKTPGPGAQAVVRTLARSGIRVGRIEDVTPLPTDSMKRKGGRRGRRV